MPSEVADRMIEQVTEANGWSYRQAVGNGPTRGICKMRFNRPHEGMRLTMVYAAAWAVTGEKRYFDLYRKYLDEGVAKSMELAQMTPQELARIRAQPFADRASCCRIVHLFGAWWRFRRLACRR